MEDLAPLETLLKRRELLDAQKTATTVATQWISKDNDKDKDTDAAEPAPAYFHGLALEPIAESLVRKSHPRVLIQRLTQQINQFLPEQAFCLLDLSAPAPKRLLIQDGLHYELSQILLGTEAAIDFPFIFSGQSTQIASIRDEASISVKALASLEFIQSGWVFSSRDTEGHDAKPQAAGPEVYHDPLQLVFVVFGAESNVPNAEQLRFGQAVLQLSTLLFSKQTKDQLSNDVLAELQGLKISAGQALLHLLTRS